MDHQTYIGLLYILPGALLLLSLLWAVFVPLRSFRKVRSAYVPSTPSERSGNSEISENSGISGNSGTCTPGLSVIAYCMSDEDEIEKFIRAVEKQRFRDFEVIIVTGSGLETSSILSERYRDLPWVSFTFIPPQTHNLSRHKLAYTLGIKRAKGEIVLTTMTNVSIPSDRWLEDMVSPFRNPWVQFALGYSHPDFSEFPKRLRGWINFREICESAVWISAALSGKTLRGDGHNLAFRKELFFRNNGYSASNHLVGGDDDIFVHSLAAGDNCAVVLSADSILTVEWGASARRMYRGLRERHRFDYRFLPRLPRLMGATLPLCNWMALLSAAALATAFLTESPFNWTGACASLFPLLLLWLVESVTIGKAAVINRSAPSPLKTPFRLLFLPFASLWSRMHSHSRMNYNWDR